MTTLEKVQLFFRKFFKLLWKKLKWDGSTWTFGKTEFAYSKDQGCYSYFVTLVALNANTLPSKQYTHAKIKEKLW